MAQTTENYDDLYVCIQEPTIKRKYILSTLKNSLIMQEEFEKLMNIRKEKQEVLKEIKKYTNNVNKNYVQLKKFLPNVKNVLSVNEEESKLLKEHTQTLRNEIREDRAEIRLETKLEKEIQKGEYVAPKKQKQVKKEPETKMVKNTQKHKLSRIDRIKNNLRVIENKLKDI